MIPSHFKYYDTKQDKYLSNLRMLIFKGTCFADVNTISTQDLFDVNF